MAHAGCLLYVHVRDPRFLDSPWFLGHLLAVLRWHKIHLWKQGTDSGYRIKGIVLKSTWFMTNYQLEIPVWQLLVIRAAEGNLRNTGTLEGDWKKPSEAALSPVRGAPCTLTSRSTQACSGLCLFSRRCRDLQVTSAESVGHSPSSEDSHPIRPFEELALLRRKCHNSWCLIFTGSHGTDKWDLLHTCFLSVT